MRFVRWACVRIWLIALLAWIASYFSNAQVSVRRDLVAADETVVRGWRIHATWGALCLTRDLVTFRGAERNKSRPPGFDWSWHASASEIGGKFFIDQKQPHYAGFQYAVRNLDKPTLVDRTRSVLVPPWFIALVLSILPARWALRWYVRWRRRRTPGLCIRCGYDLRASPERCPECGTMPENLAAPA